MAGEMKPAMPGEKMCRARLYGPPNFECTLAAGHGGSHAAHGIDDRAEYELLAEWPRASPTGGTEG